MAEVQPLILFGDGHQALYYDEKNPRINRDSVRVQPILLVPSLELKHTYGLTDNDLVITTHDNRKGLWMEYPVKQIDWLNRSRGGAVLFIWCAFNSDNTPVMRKIDELFEWDQQRDRTESRLRAEVMTLQRELESVTSNQAELMRKLKVLKDMAGEHISEEEEGGGEI